MEPVDPQILVVADQLGLVMRQDPAVACGRHDLGVHDVGEALEHAPFPVPRSRAGVVAGVGEQ